MTVVVVIAVVFVLVVGVLVVVVVLVAVVLMPIVFVVVAKAMVCAGAVIDPLAEVVVIDVRADVLINVVDAVEITLEFALSVLYSVDEVFSNVVVDLLMGAFSGVRVVIMIGVRSGSDVDVLVDVNVNVFADIMSVDFAMPAPLEGFRC